MNPNDIPAAGPVDIIFWNAVSWIDPIVYFIGLGVAIWAFSRCRKWGYLVIGVYFALLLFSLLAMPAIHRAMSAHDAPENSEQTRQKIDIAVQQAIERVMAESGNPVVTATKTVHFSIGPIVLVVGLWLIARFDSRKDRSNKVPQATSHTP